MPLFSRPRSPAEIVRNLKEALNTLERGGDSKKQEKVRKNSTDLITYFVSQSKNLRKNSSSNGGTEDEETRKIRFFRQVWSCYIFFCNTFYTSKTGEITSKKNFRFDYLICQSEQKSTNERIDCRMAAQRMKKLTK